MNKTKLSYSAILHPLNLRDVNTTVPKVLLTNVMQGEELFRDHCYINIEGSIAKLLKTLKTKVIITFDAGLKTYGINQDKQTLTKITSIKNLGRA